MINQLICVFFLFLCVLSTIHADSSNSNGEISLELNLLGQDIFVNKTKNLTFTLKKNEMELKI